MERRLSPTLAGIGLAGALLWFALGAPAREIAAAPDVAPLVSDIDARIRETIAAVQARADTLGQLPRLRSAVATDEQTVRDLTSDELAFRTRAGEHIEIAQVARHDGHDGATRSLLRLPDDKLPLPMGSTGIHLAIANGRLQAMDIVPVTPSDRDGELRGALAVAEAIDLSPFAPRFQALGLQASLRLGERSVALAGQVPSGSPARTAPLASAATEAASLEIFGGGIIAAPARSRPLFGPLALLLAGLVAALAVRGRGAPKAAEVPPPGPSIAPALAPRELTSAAPRALTPPAPFRSGGPAALPLPRLTPPAPRTARPTPPPLPERGATPIALVSPFVGIAAEPEDATPVPQVVGSGNSSGSLSRPVRESSGRSPNEPRPSPTTLPSHLFEVGKDGSRPMAAEAGNDDPLAKEYRGLFVEFTKMRRACREPIENLDAELFVAVLHRQRDELMQKHTGREIRFRIAFDNGRAAIRYVLD